MQRILVWDVPTRVFHWMLAACFALAWLTSESDVWLSHHVFLGYVMLGLVGFRVLWGCVGGVYARFGSFRFSPRQGLAYLREVLAGGAARHIGHNPAGSQAIYLLLPLIVVVAVSGVFAMGADEQHGVAAGWMGFAAGRFLKQLHEASAIFMLLVVAGHVVGVGLERRLHQENLARSMLTGYKLAGDETPASKPHRTVAALLVALLLASGVAWFFYAPQQPGGVSVRVAFVGPALAVNARWRDECGSCHLDFHPSLLPRRSWVRLMEQQGQHFGVDLGLDSATVAALLVFASANASEGHQTEPAFKIDSSIPSQAVPLRITDTPYWTRKHRDVAAQDWQAPWIKSKANCQACHADAPAGAFEDGSMHIPRSAPAAR